jgi:hypothetical protein
VGEAVLPDRRVFCLLNWSESPQTLSFSLRGPHRMQELWTDAELGRRAGGLVSQVLPGRTGRVFHCTPVR